LATVPEVELDGSLGDFGDLALLPVVVAVTTNSYLHSEERPDFVQYEQAGFDPSHFYGNDCGISCFAREQH
jgi:hypothetical protein